MFKDTEVLLPIPVEYPFTGIKPAQLELLKIEQSEVAVRLNVNRAKTVLVFGGKTKVPKSQTKEPVAPKFGLKEMLFGVGVVCGLKTVPTALPGT